MQKAHWGSFVLALGVVACSKPESRFHFSKAHKDRELLVTLDPAQNVPDLKSALSSYPHTLEALEGQTYLLRFQDERDLEATAEEIAQHTGIAHIEANTIYHLEETLPDDPEFAKLYGMKNSGQNSGVAGADIRATQAWDLSTGDSKVVLALIDSGVDYRHPDLKDNMWINAGETGIDEEGKDKRTNGKDDDNDGFVDDYQGWDFYNNDNDPLDDNSHGTHVAGTIGARGNNGVGVVGVNWNVTIVPIKVFSAAGDSTADVLIRGIDYATKLKVVASNNSWGGGGYSQAMFEAVQRHSDAGSLFIAAAGNESTDNDAEAHYPSTYPVSGIISVASTNRRDRISGFSNYGKKSVMVAAPGEDIYSTLPNGGYGVKSGTSMATPHVTGLVGLIKAAYPSLDAAAIKARILATAAPIPTLVAGVATGRIDAASALENDAAAPGHVQDVQIESTGLRDVTLSWQEAGDDGDTGKASRYLLRLSQEAIHDEESWNRGTTLQASHLVVKEGRVQGTISGLDYNTTGFVTLRAVDNVGNVGTFSDSQSFTLKPMRIVKDFTDTKGDAWESLEGTWAFQTVDGTDVLSDSPEGRYENSTNLSAISRSLTIDSPDVVLDVRSRWSLEASYDFAYLEVSIDQGKSWKLLSEMSGSSGGWQIQSFPLREILGEAKTFALRCRIKSDFSVNGDGWDIRSIQLVAQQTE